MTAQGPCAGLFERPGYGSSADGADGATDLVVYIDTM